MTDPSYRCASATGRSEPYFSSETSRSRLSSANLEQNHHVYRNHPQNLDYHGEHLALAVYKLLRALFALLSHPLHSCS